MSLGSSLRRAFPRLCRFVNLKPTTEGSPRSVVFVSSRLQSTYTATSAAEKCKEDSTMHSQPENGPKTSASPSPGMDADQFRAAAHAVIEESEHQLFPIAKNHSDKW